MLEPRTVANAYVRSLLNTAQACGALSSEVLRGLPLDEAALAAPSGRVGVALVNRIWERAVALSADPALGLKLAGAVTPSTFRVLGLAVMSCATLHEAIQILLRYQRLVSEAGTLSARPGRRGEVDLVYTQQPLRFQMLPQQVEAILASVVCQARWLAGHSLPAVHATFRHPPQASLDEYRRVLGADPEFDADEDRLSLTPTFLTTPLPHADAELCRLHCDLADEELARLPQIGSIGAFTLQWLASRASGTIRVGDLAQALGLSVRNLQRQLAAEGRSWSQLVDTARRDALQSLVRKGLPLGEAAERMGYHDASSLSRAARRWFGMPPGKWARTRKPDSTS
ncbi:MAG: AraC family transcriptional regulator [Sinimarinibacterium sp.]|jgi:AraC-like DNA-binding protein